MPLAGVVLGTGLVAVEGGDVLAGGELYALAESLRVEEEELGTLKAGDFEELDGIYKSRRARVFLEGLRKELGL